MLISILRTFVPYAWGIIIGAVLSAVPVLEPLREQLLASGDAAVPVIAAILAGAWYALWRWLEPKLPDWLTRAVLGSAKAPTYDAPTTDGDTDQTSPDQRADPNGRHEASTQDYTDDTTIHSGEGGDYPVGDPHGPTQADPERYTQ